MPVSEFHGQVAAIALHAAAPHGFALGGGNALIAHGIVDRFTQDVDVFSDEEGGVEAAADAVEAALRDAGFGTERRDKTGGLTDVFYGMGEGLAEWIVIAPGGEQMMLQMAYFDRARRPVTSRTPFSGWTSGVTVCSRHSGSAPRASPSCAPGSPPGPGFDRSGLPSQRACLHTPPVTGLRAARARSGSRGGGSYS
jgi:hypothetical protein